MICHGNGDLAKGGCCYVGGRVCPLRWKREENGNITQGADTDLGPASELAETLGMPNGKARNLDGVMQGRTFICSVAAKAIANDPSLSGDPDALAEAWDNDPDYVEQVRPTWAEIEDRLNLPEGHYNCSTWRGSNINGRAQCCFAESEQENAQKAQGLGNPGTGVGTDQD